jgi:multicomponent Na+:H+ antiporter subunit D
MTSLIAIPLGVLLGLLGGYFKGWVDSIVVWLSATVASMPGLLFILAISLVVGQGLLGIYMGIGLGTEAGMMAAMFHLFSHTLCKSMLFLAAGGLADASGNSKVFRDLRGAGYRSPIAGVAFTIGALSMVGFPFLGGFVAKFNFALAALEAGSIYAILVLIVLAISTALNTVYFLRTVITLYRKPLETAHYPVEKGQRGLLFNVSLVCFSVTNVVLGLFSQSIVNAIVKGLSTFG